MPSLGYVILWVDDLERAVRFYTATLGFAEKIRHGEYVELATGETTFALVARRFVRDQLHLEVAAPGAPSSEIAIVVPRARLRRRTRVRSRTAPPRCRSRTSSRGASW